MGEWNFARDVIQSAKEIGIGDRVRVHWSEAECQDQDATVVGVQIERHGKVNYSLHIDGDVSPTDGFYHDRTGSDAGSISLLPDLSAVALPDELGVVAWHWEGRARDYAFPVWAWQKERPATAPENAVALADFDQAHSTIAALRAEIERLAETVKRQGEDILERTRREQKQGSELVRWQGKFETAEAEVKRLTEEKEGLRAEIERMTPKFVAYEYLESPARAEAAEARIKALEDALRPFADGWLDASHTAVIVQDAESGAAGNARQQGEGRWLS